jgi:glycosyltransferase involved in cell wall biosynthesis
MSIRVAVVTGSYPPALCGVADYVWQLRRALRERGLEVAVFTRARASREGEEPDPGVHRSVERWNGPAVRELLERVRSFRPDVIHLQYQTALFDKGLAITRLARRVRRGGIPARTVVTFHDLNGPRIIPRVPSAGRPVLRGMAHDASGVVVTNEVDLAVVRGWGLPRDEPRLIPVGPTILHRNGDPNEAARTRAELGVSPVETLFVYFGLLMRDKGVKTLVDAASLLPPGGWRLLFLASPRNHAEERERELLQERAGRLGFAQRFLWRAHLAPADVSRLLNACDIGVLPFDEGLSTRRSSFAVLAEHSLPLVSTVPRLWPAIFGDESPALLVPPRHPAQLARALRWLLVSPGGRDLLRQRSRQLARRISWGECARKTEEHYLHLLQGSA